MRHYHIKLIFVVLVVIAGPLWADRILYVDDDAPMGGDGVSWDTAYRFLQDALADANNRAPERVEVHVAAGVYEPDQSEVYPASYGYASGDREAMFVIPSGVTVRGAYYGLPALSTSAAILSGDLAGNDKEVASPELLSGERAMDRDALRLPSDPDDGIPKMGGEPTRLDNSFHVVRMEDNSALIGVIVTGGYAHRYRASGGYTVAFTSDHGGGGVWINGNDTSLRDCLITGNYAEEVGGGVWCPHAEDVNLVDCTIRGNATRYFGGGVWVRDSSIFFENCTLVRNWAEFERGGGGYIESCIDITKSLNWLQIGNPVARTNDRSKLDCFLTAATSRSACS